MAEYYYRTEDIDLDDIPKLFVETLVDREIVDKLKSRNPVVLVGSRGVGKSFLLRVAERELLDELSERREFPVYVNFIKSSLFTHADETVVRSWMMSRICSLLIRRLQKEGLLVARTAASEKISGGASSQMALPPIEQLSQRLEAIWRNPDVHIDLGLVPTVEEFMDSVEDLLEECNLKKVVFLFDEAAHIFLPEQQRIFFTLFRDLRCSKIVCNAAVYPGVTSYGDTFQTSHDASMIALDRDINSDSYIDNMKDIVARQADAKTMVNINKNGSNFAALAYAASGNPRLLLKTIGLAPKISSSQVNEVIRDFYRVAIWSDHSNLAEKYSGHKCLIDWGRQFIEEDVLLETQKKNQTYVEVDKATTAYFWMHRDCPEEVRQSIRILCYTGIVKEDASGIRATRSEIGTRYMLNLGALFALESSPALSALEIAKKLTPKRMTEYGANYPSFSKLSFSIQSAPSELQRFSLDEQMARDINVLDLTDWQKGKIRDLGITTVGEAFDTPESEFQKAYYVGHVRARQMRNAAHAAVLEYLSG